MTGDAGGGGPPGDAGPPAEDALAQERALRRALQQQLAAATLQLAELRNENAALRQALAASKDHTVSPRSLSPKRSPSLGASKSPRSPLMSAINPADTVRSNSSSTGLSPTVRSHARPAALEDLAATVVASPTASRVGSRTASMALPDTVGPGQDAVHVQVLRLLVLAAQGSPVALHFLSRVLSMPAEAIKQLGRRHSNIFVTDQRHVIGLRKVAPPKADGWKVDAPGEIPHLILVVKTAFDMLSRSQKASCSYKELEDAAEWQTRCPGLAAELVFPRLLHYFERVAHDPKSQCCRLRLYDAPYASWKQSSRDSPKAGEAESPSKRSPGHVSPMADGKLLSPDTVLLDSTEEESSQSAPDLYGLAPDGTPYHRWVFQIAVSSMPALPTTPAPRLEEPMVMVSVTHEDVGAKIWKFISGSLPSGLELEQRSELRRDLEGLLASNPKFFRKEAPAQDGEPGAVQPQLYVFGSCATNTFVAGADMDLCFVYAKDCNGYLSRREVQDKVEEMYAILKRDHRFKGKLCRVVHAKVPILKKGPPKCFDISLSSWCGVRNSALIRKYVEAHPMVQPLAIAVNGWSKWAAINDAPNGLLNSYTLLLMLIYFLLRIGEVDLIPIDTPLELVPQPAYRPPSLQPSDHERLGRLAVWFFHFYTHDFRWDADVVCIRTSALVTRAFKGWLTAPLAVEDPFETHLNTARNLGEHPCRLVKAAFEQSLDALLRGQFVDVITTGKTKTRDAPSAPTQPAAPVASPTSATAKATPKLASASVTKAGARARRDSATVTNPGTPSTATAAPSAATPPPAGAAVEPPPLGPQSVTALAQQLLTMSCENRALRKMPEMKDPELVVYALRELCLDFGDCKAVARACRIASIFFDLDPSHHDRFDEMLLPLIHLKVAELVDDTPPGLLLEFCYLATPSLPRCLHRLYERGDMKHLGKTMAIASHFARRCGEAVEAVFQVADFPRLMALLRLLTNPEQLAGAAAVPVVAALLAGLASDHQDVIQNGPLPSPADIEFFISSAEWYHYKGCPPQETQLAKPCLAVARLCLRLHASTPDIS
eukprot:EG_transcript_1661